MQAHDEIMIDCTLCTDHADNGGKCPGHLGPGANETCGAFTAIADAMGGVDPLTGDFVNFETHEGILNETTDGEGRNLVAHNSDGGATPEEFLNHVRETDHTPENMGPGEQRLGQPGEERTTAASGQAGRHAPQPGRGDRQHHQAVQPCDQGARFRRACDSAGRRLILQEAGDVL